MGSDVVVIGDALLDVRVTPAAPPRRGSDVPAAISLEPGGQGANVAVRLARRGIDVGLVCALADDVAGDLLRSRLAAEGVHLTAVPVATTGSVVVLVDPVGERSMLSQRVPLLTSGDLEVGVPRWLVVSGYLLLEPAAARFVPALPGERRMVVGCALDPGEADRWLATLRALRPSLIVLNATEAAVLGLDGDARSLDAVVVVTRADGATASVGDELVVVDSVSNDEPIDTTGAGDAYAAALLAELLRSSWPPSTELVRGAMGEAARAAAAVTLVPGAQASVPGEHPAAATR